MKLNVLCIGDVVGRPGRRIIADKLRLVVKEHDVDCVIVNAENAAGGSGLTRQIYDKLLRYGVNLITLGDHTYRKREIVPTLETADNIVRPVNFSRHAAGKGFAIYKTGKGPTVAIVALIGRLFMKPGDCPYDAIDRILPQLEQKADIIIVDFHAEATSEKRAMGFYLDGEVAVCFGTHTHVPTADEEVLPKGTAYVSDIGMSGPYRSVIGRRADRVIYSMTTRMYAPFDLATADVRSTGVLVEVDPEQGIATSIRRVTLWLDEGEQEGGAGA